MNNKENAKSTVFDNISPEVLERVKKGAGTRRMKICIA